MASSLAPAVARAQEATALDRFDPAPAADALFSIPSAGVRGELRPGAALTVTYADQPLVLRGTGRDTSRLEWVDHQVILHALLSVEIARRLKLDLDLPFTLDQGGASGTIGGTAAQAPEGAAIGDVRAGARVALLRQRGLIPAAALRLSAWLPSGDEGAFSGTSSVRFAPALVVGGEHRRWLWSATIGGRFQPEDAESLQGSEVLGGAGVAARLGRLQIGPEVFFGAGADNAASLVRSRAGAEMLIGARYALGPLTFGAAGGPGFGRAPGPPTFRLVASVGVATDLRKERATRGPRSPIKLPFDRGGARAPRAESPPAPPDLDGDTVPDAEDACPSVIGEAQRGAKRRGCPPDRDGDGFYDVDDRCPDAPGVASSSPEKNGCPADTDGDGIIDAEDACPDERGKRTESPETNGCPVGVRLEGTQIVMLQQVNFATARAEIKEDSFPLLQAVVSVLEEHPEIARVAVDGHTDNKGAEVANLNLSRRRALAVVQWLAEHGVDARRLEARGFGPRRPIADNGSEEGRAKNRRVEFQIRRRTPLGAAGWRDGPLD